VKHIIYENSSAQLREAEAFFVSDQYGTTLESYVQIGLKNKRYTCLCTNTTFISRILEKSHTSFVVKFMLALVEISFAKFTNTVKLKQKLKSVLLSHGNYRLVSKKFENRVDASLVHLATLCPNLKLLAIREILSAGTLLKVAEICSARKDSFRFFVRKNFVLLQLDRSRYEFSNVCAKNIGKLTYENVWAKIEEILGEKSMPLTDNRYLHLL